MRVDDIILRPFQDKTLSELGCISSIGLLYKTGAGKTKTSIVRFGRNPTPNLLVICPQKVITQWQKLLKKHLPDNNVFEYNLNWTAKRKREELINFINKSNNFAVVVNYDILPTMDLSVLIDDTWTIILDESHKIKNMGTKKHPVKATAECLKLGECTKYKMILTATPTEKKFGGYEDLYPQLKFLGYVDYSYQYFVNKYCKTQKLQIPGTPFPIKKIVGYNDNISEIKDLMKICCRYYAPKYGDYEPQHEKVIVDKCDNYNKTINQKTYKEITIDNTAAMRIMKKTLTTGTVMGTDEYNQHFVYEDNSSKLDWLEEFLSNTDDVVSILYVYNVERDRIKKLCEKLGKTYVVIDGTIKDKPAELEKDFDVLIGQYEAFGESLDGLQYKCHLMVLFALPESSRAYRQSIGRIDRDGQKEVPVYYHLVMEKTLDEQIFENNKNKVDYSEKDLNDLTI